MLVLVEYFVLTHCQIVFKFGQYLHIWIPTDPFHFTLYPTENWSLRSMKLGFILLSKSTWVRNSYLLLNFFYYLDETASDF